MAITPVDEAEVAMAADKDQGVGPCCKVGNLVPADNLMPDFISGAEKYAYMWLVEPVCECNTGFYLDTVQMIVQFGPEDVPVTIQVNASFEETQWDATGGHLIPGPPICTSPTYTGTVTEAGSFRISVPLMNANCLCAEFGYHYAVSMNILTSLEGKLDLVLADDRSAASASSTRGTGGTIWIPTGSGRREDGVQAGVLLQPGEGRTAFLGTPEGPVPVDRRTDTMQLRNPGAARVPFYFLGGCPRLPEVQETGPALSPERKSGPEGG